MCAGYRDTDAHTGAVAYTHVRTNADTHTDANANTDIHTNAQPNSHANADPVLGYENVHSRRTGHRLDDVGQDVRLYRRQEAEVHSVLIVRNGYMVTEAYFHPYNQDRTHRLTSCTKSFLSALVGIAVDEGLLDLDAKVLDFFPGYTIANDSPLKREITVEHLLLMRSGLNWPESSVSYNSSDNILRQMMSSRNWEQFILDRPMAVAPGSVFNYSTGDSQILGAVLEQATGMAIQEFAQTRLFESLQVPPRQWYWTSAPEGTAFAVAACI
ncbi:MAG: serine hydrolase domain-containing protein [Anaerolineae bacterium]